MGTHRPPPTCKVCGAPIQWIGNGRPPVYCSEHGRKGNVRGQVERGERVLRPLEGDEGGRDRELREAQRRSQVALRAAGARLLAIGLRHDPDPQRAAAFAGLPEDMDAAEFIDLLEEAQSERLKPLRTGSRLAIAATLGAALAATAEHLMARISEIPATQLPGAVKALAQAQDYVGGGALVYSSVELRFAPPPDYDEAALEGASA